MPSSLSRALIAVFVAGSVALTLPAASGAAVVTGGDADWGVKESFREYVQGPVAMGQITTSDGATTSGDGTFDFQPASGTFDPLANTANAKFRGTVLFTGHAGALSLKVTDPRVAYSGSAGTLFADVTSKDLNSGQVKSYPNVDFASLNLTGIVPLDSGSTATVSAVPATLTANGARAFAGFYDAGTQLDPISFSISYSNAPVSAGKVAAGRKTQKVSDSSREVKLATATCEATACALSVDPRAIKAQISGGPNDGEAFNVKAKAPSTLAQGETAAVLIKVKKGLVRKLGKGGKAVLSTGVELSTGGDTVTETVKVKVKGKKRKKG